MKVVLYALTSVAATRCPVGMNLRGGSKGAEVLAGCSCRSSIGLGRGGASFAQIEPALDAGLAEKSKMACRRTGSGSAAVQDLKKKRSTLRPVDAGGICMPARRQVLAHSWARPKETS